MKVQASGYDCERRFEIKIVVLKDGLEGSWYGVASRNNAANISYRSCLHGLVSDARPWFRRKHARKKEHYGGNTPSRPRRVAASIFSTHPSSLYQLPHSDELSSAGR